MKIHVDSPRDRGKAQNCGKAQNRRNAGKPGTPRNRGKARNYGKAQNRGKTGWLSGWLTGWSANPPPSRGKPASKPAAATTAPEEIFRLARPSDGRNIASA